MKKPKILYDSEASEDEEEKTEVPNSENPLQETEKPLQEKKGVELEEKKGDWLEFVDDNLENKKTKGVPKFECEYCHNKFVRDCFLKKHINENRCKVKRELDNQLLEEAKTLLAKKQKKELDKVRPKRKYVKKIQPLEEEIKLTPPPPPKPIQQPKPQQPKPQPQPIPQKPKFIIRF